MANVLVIGEGGREHALCWKLAASPKVETVFIAPGNADISKEEKVSVAKIDVKDFKAVATFCKNNSVGLVVVGPEEPLVNGIADELATEGILCFGPSKAAARIEADKIWAKVFMVRYEIPSVRWHSFADPEDAKNFMKSAPFPALVVKAIGLAASKVVLAADNQEACKVVDLIFSNRKFGVAGDVVVIEELLVGEKVSVLAFCDGSNVKLILPAYEHSRLMAGQMVVVGSCIPNPSISVEEIKLIEEQVLKRTVEGLKCEGTPFVGVLYACLIMTKDGPKVIDFNCRFGDLEPQIILPLLESDIFNIMMACCTGKLNEIELKWNNHLNAVGGVGYLQTLPGAHINTVESMLTISRQEFQLQFLGLEQRLVARLEQMHNLLNGAKEQQEDLEGRSGKRNSLKRNCNAINEVELPTASALQSTKLGPYYINTSLDSFARDVLIESTHKVQNGNFFVSFTAIYQAIGIICLKQSTQFPDELKSVTGRLLQLAGKDVTLYLETVFEDLQEMKRSITSELKVLCNAGLVEQEQLFETLKSIGMQVEAAQSDYLANNHTPLVSTIGKVQLNADQWSLFELKDTIMDDFLCEGGKTLRVPMMVSSPIEVAYRNWHNSTTLVVPMTDDGNLKMLLFLPDQGFNIYDIEKHFSSLIMHSLITGSQLKSVQLQMPKFSDSMRMTGIDLSKLVLQLYRRGQPSLADGNGLNLTLETQVMFSEKQGTQNTRAFKWSKKHVIDPVSTIKFNKPFAFIVYYKTNYAIMGGRVAFPKQAQPEARQETGGVVQLQGQACQNPQPIVSRMQAQPQAAESGEYFKRQPLLSNCTIGGSVVSSTRAEDGEGTHAGGTVLNAPSNAINLAPGSNLHILNSGTTHIHGDVNVSLNKPS